MCIQRLSDLPAVVHLFEATTGLQVCVFVYLGVFVYIIHLPLFDLLLIVFVF